MRSPHAQNKKWLTSAFEAMTVNEAKRMGELAHILAATEVPDGTPDALAALPPLHRPDAPDGVSSSEYTAQGLAQLSASLAHGATASLKVGALEELTDYVESIDNAKDLFVVGGFGPLLHCVAGPASSPAVRIAAAAALSTVLQNNPKAQAWALEQGTMQALAGTLRDAGAASAATEGESAVDHVNVRAAVLTALSCLVRDNAAGQAELMRPHSIAATATPPAGGAGSAVPLSVGQQLLAAVVHAHAAAPSSGVWSLVVAPIVEWAVMHNQPVSQPASPLLVKAQRRLVRKALFFVRHLLGGTSCDALCTALLSHPTPPGIVPTLLRVLAAATPGVPTGEATESSGCGDDADDADTRDHVLHILLALASPPAEGVSVVDDTGDRRRVKGGITVGAAAAATASITAALAAGVAAAGAGVATSTSNGVSGRGGGDVETQPEALEAARLDAEAATARAAAAVTSATATPSSVSTGAAPSAGFAASSTSEALIVIEGPVGAEGAASATDSLLSLARRRTLLRQETTLVAAMQAHARWAVEAARRAALPSSSHIAAVENGAAGDALGSEADGEAAALAEEAGLAGAVLEEVRR